MGIGKTTISRALASALHGRVISIDRILDDHNLWYGGYPSEFLRANEFGIAEAIPHLLRGTPVIFDGNFYYRSQIKDLARRLEFPHAVFTLKAPLSECIERDAHRAHSYGEDAVREVFRKVARVEWGIDLDARRPVRQVTAEIVRRLRDTSTLERGNAA